MWRLVIKSTPIRHIKRQTAFSDLSPTILEIM